MGINLQNKIYGKNFCIVGLAQELVNNKPVYVVAPNGPGIQWRLNKSTLVELGIDYEIIKDFIKALANLGSIEDLRAQLGLEPNSQIIAPGLVLKHPKRPDLLANVIIYPGPNMNSYNPNTYAMPYDIELQFYVDVDKVGPSEYRDGEEDFKIINALSSNNMSSSQNVDQDSEVAKGESKNPISSEGYESLYESLIK
jgi:hypothetical protein